MDRLIIGLSRVRGLARLRLNRTLYAVCGVPTKLISRALMFYQRIRFAVPLSRANIMGAVGCIHAPLRRGKLPTSCLTESEICTTNKREARRLETTSS